MSPSLYVDVHAHLDMNPLYEQIAEVIGRAQKTGVSHIITNGIDPSSNRISLQLASTYATVHAACGIYPQSFTDTFTKEKFIQECHFIENNKKDIIAIGEIGLDYKEEISHEDQHEIFHAMLSLAQKLKKPVIVHTRKAEADVLEILDQYRLPAVILHCFSGKKSLIKTAQQKGYFFSIPANITRAMQFQELVKMVPLHQLLTETDSPFLAPTKETINEPSSVATTIRVIAELRGMTEEETLQNIYFNYQKIF